MTMPPCEKPDEVVRLEQRLAEVPELVNALRTALTWLATPSDVQAQHRETLIRVTHEMRAVLAGWEQQS